MANEWGKTLMINIIIAATATAAKKISIANLNFYVARKAETAGVCVCGKLQMNWQLWKNCVHNFLKIIQPPPSAHLWLTVFHHTHNAKCG